MKIRRCNFFNRVILEKMLKLFYTRGKAGDEGGEGLKVIFYTHASCGLCEEAKTLLDILSSMYDVTIEERDIYTKDEWLEAYLLSVPVIEIAEKQFMYPNITIETISHFIEEKQSHSS